MGGDKETSSKELDDFRKRLFATASSVEKSDKRVASNGSVYSFGLRLVTDMLAAVFAGVGIGWLLDYWLGTTPWLFLIFMFLGMAAGILNVVRAAKSIEGQRHLEKTNATGILGVPIDDDE